METELKLEIAPQDRAALLASPSFRGATTQAMRTVYFDTPFQTLRTAGFALRVRQVGDRNIQTIKADGPAAAGLFVRGEWEQEIEGDTPRPDGPEHPLAAHVGRKLLSSIGPVFRTDISRSAALRKGRAATIELVLDQGEIVAADRIAPVCEVELELRRGAPSALFALARTLDAVAPVRLGVLGKSERGYRLTDGSGGRPAKSEAVALRGDMTAAAAFQTIAAVCIRQFRLNEMLLAETKDAGALHQARVGLRRLRSAVSLFGPMLADDRSGHLRAELRWIAGTLGEARDIDVLVERVTDMDVRARLIEARADAYAGAHAALTSTRLRHLMLDLAEWLAIGAWLTKPETAGLRDLSIVENATAILDRYRKRVKRRGAGLTKLDDERRHALRIETKKLRYATEFLASLYTGKTVRRRARRFQRSLATLQEHLGDLNDLATAPTVLASLGLLGEDGKAEQPTPTTFARSLKKADAAYDALMDAKRFWE